MLASLRQMDFAGVAAVALMGLTCAAVAKPLEPLESRTDGYCYSRAYDAAHLQRHPSQQTEAVVLSFKQDAVRIEFRPRGQKPRYVVAACEWNKAAGRDINGKRLIPAFTKDSGYDCIVMTTPLSAEEGGYAILDATKDQVTLYIDDPVSVQDGLGKDHGVSSMSLGREDRVFKLTRTDRAACRPMEDGLTAP